MQIICRHARDDFSALMTAQGMEDAGADVFSITLNSGNNPMARFVIFAKHDPDVMCATSPAQIDEAIMRRLYPEGAPSHKTRMPMENDAYRRLCERLVDAWDQALVGPRDPSRFCKDFCSKAEWIASTARAELDGVGPSNLTR